MGRPNILKQVYVRPLDLSVDETLFEIQAAVREIGAKRVVIDSLTGLEIALAPTFEQDFRESLYRLVGALTGERPLFRAQAAPSLDVPSVGASA